MLNAFYDVSLEHKKRLETFGSDVDKSEGSINRCTKWAFGTCILHFFAWAPPGEEFKYFLWVRNLLRRQGNAASIKKNTTFWLETTKVQCPNLRNVMCKMLPPRFTRRTFCCKKCKKAGLHTQFANAKVKLHFRKTLTFPRAFKSWRKWELQKICFFAAKTIKRLSCDPFLPTKKSLPKIATTTKNDLAEHFIYLKLYGSTLLEKLEFFITEFEAPDFKAQSWEGPSENGAHWFEARPIPGHLKGLVSILQRCQTKVLSEGKKY